MHITLQPSVLRAPGPPFLRLLIPTTDFSPLCPAYFPCRLKYFKSIQWQKRLLYLLPLRMRAGLIRCQWTANCELLGAGNWEPRELESWRAEGAARWAALQCQRKRGTGIGFISGPQTTTTTAAAAMSYSGGRKDVDAVAISHWYFGIWALSARGERGIGDGDGVALRGGWNLIRLRWARSIVFALSVTSKLGGDGGEGEGCETSIREAAKELNLKGIYAVPL